MRVGVVCELPGGLASLLVACLVFSVLRLSRCETETALPSCRSAAVGFLIRDPSCQVFYARIVWTVDT